MDTGKLLLIDVHHSKHTSPQGFQFTVSTRCKMRTSKTGPSVTATFLFERLPASSDRCPEQRFARIRIVKNQRLFGSVGKELLAGGSPKGDRSRIVIAAPLGAVAVEIGNPIGQSWVHFPTQICLYRNRRRAVGLSTHNGAITKNGKGHVTDFLIRYVVVGVVVGLSVCRLRCSFGRRMYGSGLFEEASNH